MKVTEAYCDIKDCKNLSFKEDVRLSVVFTTEQNGGLLAEMPYLSTNELDLCKTHYEDYLFRTPIIASGAMGYNDYNMDLTLTRSSFKGVTNEPSED